MKGRGDHLLPVERDVHGQRAAVHAGVRAQRQVSHPPPPPLDGRAHPVEGRDAALCREREPPPRLRLVVGHRETPPHVSADEVVAVEGDVGAVFAVRHGERAPRAVAEVAARHARLVLARAHRVEGLVVAERRGVAPAEDAGKRHRRQHGAAVAQLDGRGTHLARRWREHEPQAVAAAAGGTEPDGGEVAHRDSEAVAAVDEELEGELKVAHRPPVRLRRREQVLPALVGVPVGEAEDAADVDARGAAERRGGAAVGLGLMLADPKSG